MYKFTNQIDFAEWRSQVENKALLFVEKFETLIDESAEQTLLNIGKWLLNTYPEMIDLENDTETWDLLVCFVGETFRKSLNGVWVCEDEDERSIYYGKPVVVFGANVVLEEIKYFYNITHIFTMMIDRQQSDRIKVHYLEFIEDMTNDGAL
ncbi:hypothetical protein [Marinicellulosiphila megalodicopiae]|uniref:hypothetical protein n=1 Tax=Marinicellulosiphila megalodicopiae TaxID=2724896 RepID=UPI003BAEF2DE